MEMWRKTPAYLLLVLLLSACAGSSVKQRNNRAEALLEGSPKEAFAMLDSASNGIPAWNVPLQMRVELLHAQAMNKAFISFTTDCITLEVVNFYNFFGDNFSIIKRLLWYNRITFLAIHALSIFLSFIFRGSDNHVYDIVYFLFFYGSFYYLSVGRMKLQLEGKNCIISPITDSYSGRWTWTEIVDAMWCADGVRML